MPDNQDTKGKSADSAGGSFTQHDDKETSRANERTDAGGESVAGCPAQENARNEIYESHRHNFSDQAGPSERVPSAGWRMVYYAMGVRR